MLNCEKISKINIYNKKKYIYIEYMLYVILKFIHLHFKDFKVLI